jgi:hypothetical protein
MIVFGVRQYGKVHACGPSYIATRFFHIWFVPLLPTESHLVLAEHGDQARGVAVPLNGLSVLAGYLRVWGLIGAGLLGVSLLTEFSPHEQVAIPSALAKLVAMSVLVAAAIVGFSLLGKLSPEDRQQRAVYSLYGGYPVDPALLGPAREPLRELLMATVAERARGLAATGYRLSADPRYAWTSVALDPTQQDETLITAAFALARIEASYSPPAQRAQWDDVHRQLWARITAVNPPYLASYAEP